MLFKIQYEEIVITFLVIVIIVCQFLEGSL